eukprot:1071061-Amphidinium_carterae.1
MVHQHLVQRYSDSRCKDGRSPDMERAFQKAKAVLQVVTNALQEQKCDRMEKFIRNRDATRFNDNKKRWSWKELTAITKLSQDEILAKVLDIDAQPRVKRARATQIALRFGREFFAPLAARLFPCTQNSDLVKTWDISSDGAHHSMAASSRASSVLQNASWGWVAHADLDCWKGSGALQLNDVWGVQDMTLHAAKLYACC